MVAYTSLQPDVKAKNVKISKKNEIKLLTGKPLTMSFV
jgi:hypothetical protein